MLSEKIELLGKGLYAGIPDTLTLKNIPTASELEYVGSEDIVKTMLETILPAAIEESIEFRNLLEIDFEWVCRCLRILNYGPYHTTNYILCGTCKESLYGEYRVNLNSIDCKPLPEGFVNDIVIPADSFLDYTGIVRIKLLTIQEIQNARVDKAFQGKNGQVNMDFARICYMITEINGKKNLSPFEIKMIIQNSFSAADYKVLASEVSNLSDYGLRAAGKTTCPKCGADGATYLALSNDLFFRPTLGDIREWKNDRSAGKG